MKNGELKKKLETFVSDLNGKSRGVNEDGYTYKYRVIDREKRVFVNREFARGMSEPWFVIDKESKLITGIDVNPFIRIDEMDFYDYMVLFRMISEYINTPLKERKDDKRWRIHLFGDVDEYLNLDKNKNQYCLAGAYEGGGYQTKFTRSEIAKYLKTDDEKIIDWIIERFGEEVE